MGTANWNHVFVHSAKQRHYRHIDLYLSSLRVQAAENITAQSPIYSLAIMRRRSVSWNRNRWHWLLLSKMISYSSFLSIFWWFTKYVENPIKDFIRVARNVIAEYYLLFKNRRRCPSPVPVAVPPSIAGLRRVGSRTFYQRIKKRFFFF